VKDVKILAYTLHYTMIMKDKGYIGGAWIRFMEFLRRADKFDLKYVLVEPFPRLGGDNYESIKAADIRSYKKVGDTALMILYATFKGIRRTLKGDIALILNPIESPYGTIPAFITSLITRIPFTVIVHNAPVFHYLIEKYPEKKFSSSLRGLYGAIRYYKHKGKPIHYAILSTLFYYAAFRIMKTTTIIGIGSGATYLQSLDKKLRVKEVFPGNSIPSSVSSAIKPSNSKKYYDAVYVGTLKAEKGILDAIRAWKLVTDWNPSLKLAVIGSVHKASVSEKTTIMDTIELLITRHGLKDNVHIIGDPMIGAQTEEVLKVMKESRIMLYPTTMDSWSFAVGEALSFGLPVVAYDIQAFNIAYQNCKALIRVPVGNIRLLYRKVRNLLEEPSKLASLSKEALRYIENYYTWDQVIAAEKKLYKSLFLGEINKSYSKRLLPKCDIPNCNE